MKKFTSKLFVSIMTLALVVVTLSASTFAWFTLGNEANIEQVKVNVTTGMGLEISEDGTAWKNRISLGFSATDIEFTALSSYKGAADGLLLNKEGVVLYDKAGNVVTYNNNLGANEKNSFLEKTFFVRITTTKSGEQPNVTTTPDYDGIALKSVKVTDRDFGEAVDGADKDHSNANQWMSDFELDGQYELEKYYNFDALNAVKISFATTREVDATTHEKAEVATVLYGYENDNSQGLVSLNGVAKAYADYKEYAYVIPTDKAAVPAQGTEGEDGYVPAQAAVLGTLPTYTNVLTNNNCKVLISTDFVDAEEASKKAGVNNATEDGILPEKTLDENYLYAKVTIRIWLDGWDADCINAILDQETTLSIVLEAFKNANNG